MANQYVTKEDVQREVEQFLVDNAGLSPRAFDGSQDHSLADLGVDSLAAAELQTVIRKRFGVRIPDEPLAMSVPDVTDFISTNDPEGH